LKLAQALRAARNNTDALLDIVCPNAMYDRPIAERHRIIFYLGHLEAFDWNLLAPVLELRPENPTLDRLFAFGIDPGEGNLPSDQPSDWPRLEEVRRYNRQVRETLDAQLDRLPAQLLHVAIEHRLMHSETLAYMLHNLPYAHKIAQPQDGEPPMPEAHPHMVDVADGTVRLGLDRGEAFGWDNEFPAHEVEVAGFAVGRYKVTNREYLRYVEQGAPAPNFWRREGDGWLWRGMFEEIPLPLDWPVYVSQQEATGYARAQGKRLLSEAEFHRAAYPASPDPQRDNFDFHRWDPIAVHASAGNERGVAQMIGNGWEWTSTPFGPFAGFEAFPFYPGYSANFFDGEHYVLKGASPRTAACFARPSFRNWFRASYPYVYGTFRVAEG
jgi:iron(II)-dependent oxidoreductase